MAYTYADIKAEYRCQADLGDPWGSAMQWFFAVADSVVFYHDLDAPQEWMFRPSPMGADDESDQYQFLKECEPCAVLRFGNLLNRYCDKLELAGENY